jgi:hypothetical protein
VRHSHASKQNEHGGKSRRPSACPKFLPVILTHCHGSQNNASSATATVFVARHALRLARCSQVDALPWLVHRAFQYFAMLIHLPQFALGIHLVPAVYQQVIHNQAGARANAETVFYDYRRWHKSPPIQALKGFIAYAMYQLNANLCSSGIFSHLSGFLPRVGAPARRPDCHCSGQAGTAETKRMACSRRPLA